MSRSINRMSALLGLILAAVSPAFAQNCSRLQGAAPDQLIAYLDKTRPIRSNFPCIEFAISQLASQRYKPAIPVLTKWLDFRWPPGAHQKQRRFVIERDGRTICPAAAALEEIGADALPAVLNAVKAKPASPETVEVAVSVWMTAYKHQAPTGVALLKQEADKTRDPAANYRLRWAASKALGWCSPSELGLCAAALSRRYSN